MVNYLSLLSQAAVNPTARHPTTNTTGRYVNVSCFAFVFVFLEIRSAGAFGTFVDI